MRKLLLHGFLCLAFPAAAKDITVTATPVPLNPTDPKQEIVGSLKYIAGFALDSSALEWGGYSGMVIAADGSYLLAVSDVGHWLKLDLNQDAAGRLKGVGAARIEPLLDTAGKPVAGKEWSDAEDIATTPDGEFLVSFERRHRVWRYASANGVPHGPAMAVRIPDRVNSLPENAGLEALAVLTDGSLWLIAEGGDDKAHRSRGWRIHNEMLTELRIARSDGYEPTSAAFLETAWSPPLLLERRYTEADGPSARVSEVSIVFNTKGDYDTRELSVLKRPLTVDNFEAIAVRHLVGNSAYVYLLSDDNQSDNQRTLLLQFNLPLFSIHMFGE